MAIKIWHNPRCTKSRNGVAFLEEQGKEFEVYKYLDDTPSVADIKEVLSMLGISARELMRTTEAIYKELGLKDETNEDKLIEAMSLHGKLIQRPIIIKDGKAVIGRPTEKVLELF